MTSALDGIIAKQLSSGAYKMDMSLRAGTICRRMTNAGWQCAYLDGRIIYDKASLLNRCASALRFPDYFGHNWDALDECITEPDLIQGDGLVLVYDHAAVLFANSPRDWNIFYDIVTSAIEYWSKEGKYVYFILRNAGAIPQKVATL